MATEKTEEKRVVTNDPPPGVTAENKPTPIQLARQAFAARRRKRQLEDEQRRIEEKRWVLPFLTDEDQGRTEDFVTVGSSSGKGTRIIRHLRWSELNEYEIDQARTFGDLALTVLPKGVSPKDLAIEDKWEIAKERRAQEKNDPPPGLDKTGAPLKRSAPVRELSPTPEPDKKEEPEKKEEGDKKDA